MFLNLHFLDFSKPCSYNRNLFLLSKYSASSWKKSWKRGIETQWTCTKLRPFSCFGSFHVCIIKVSKYPIFQVRITALLLSSLNKTNFVCMICLYVGCLFIKFSHTKPKTLFRFDHFILKSYLYILYIQLYTFYKF